MKTELIGKARGICFAQRKFMGYRCKYEYDAKAILMYSDKELCVITYTLESLGKANLDSFLKHKVVSRTSELDDDSPNQNNNTEQAFSEMGDAKEDSPAKIILRWRTNPGESIKKCNFVDDERPNYVFIHFENDSTHV